MLLNVHLYHFDNSIPGWKLTGCFFLTDLLFACRFFFCVSTSCAFHTCTMPGRQGSQMETIRREPCFRNRGTLHVISVDPPNLNLLGLHVFQDPQSVLFSV